MGRPAPMGGEGDDVVTPEASAARKVPVAATRLDLVVDQDAPVAPVNSRAARRKRGQSSRSPPLPGWARG